MKTSFQIALLQGRRKFVNRFVLDILVPCSAEEA